MPPPPPPPPHTHTHTHKIFEQVSFSYTTQLLAECQTVLTLILGFAMFAVALLTLQDIVLKSGRTANCEDDYVCDPGVHCLLRHICH